MASQRFIIIELDYKVELKAKCKWPTKLYRILFNYHNNLPAVRPNGRPAGAVEDSRRSTVARDTTGTDPTCQTRVFGQCR